MGANSRLFLLCGVLGCAVAVAYTARPSSNPLSENVPPLQHHAQIIEIQDAEHRLELIERGWMPAAVSDGVVIESFQRYEASATSHLRISVTEDQLAQLQGVVFPIDWDRFPGNEQSGWFERRPHFSTRAFVRADIEPVQPLISGEFCESGTYWRVLVMPDHTGTVSSGVYQPGVCPEAETAS